LIAPVRIRCAIYTRKSTDEGLDQDFNSLDAQREAAEAYIESQKHEGWIALPDRYDDGGFSGGTIDRPALKRLMRDVEADRVDCIVVYKVDRLSRSLLDFSRLMEMLDKHNVSFVSVTQQFNTTSSMGRLTLNILLSFAQFEREIISERTRDKMSAARRRGKWVGGMPVLGYDVDPGGGRLILNRDEASRVKAIYELYLENQSLLETAKELRKRGWTSKRWNTKKGIERGGAPFDKNSLSRLLTNVIYTGRVNHKGTIYQGEHEAIVDEATWQRVQECLRGNRRSGGGAVRNKHGALLKGLLYCIPCGTAMTHTYAVKKNKRYRYYVCTRAQKEGWDTCPSKSIPAIEIENFVVDRIRCIGKDPKLASEVLEQARAQIKKREDELASEKRLLQNELKRFSAEMVRLTGSLSGSNGNGSRLTERLAELTERIQTAEERLAAVNEEVATLGEQTIDETDLKTVLSQFDPIWESLTPMERTRVVRLLVARVGYDGEAERVSLTFSPAGVKLLCEEMRLCEEEVLV
jgi:site-specific DNA recombinase